MFLLYLTLSTKATEGSIGLNQFDFYFPVMDFENETKEKKNQHKSKPVYNIYYTYVLLDRLWLNRKLVS